MSMQIETVSQPLRKSQSMPHLLSRNDSGFGFSGAGSCNVLDQMTYKNLFHHQPDDKIPCNTRLVSDFRQLLTLRQHYYPEGGWGWLLVLIGFIIQCISHGLELSFGVLALKIVKEFHQRYTYASLLGAASLSMGLLISPITICVCKRKSTRLIAVIGGLVTALGYLFTSFAIQFHQLIFSFGIIVGIGVGITRDCSTLMVAQYFKKRRDLVETLIVSGSGCGIFLMSIFYQNAIDGLGWRLGLQTITGTVFSTFILGLFYRSASLYHPQRRAILHLKNQRRKVKDKNKVSNSPPIFDFKILKSKTVRIILTSTAISSFGAYTPIFYLVENITNDGMADKILPLQAYMGIAWMLGCIIFGALVVRNSVECRIGKQYLCQISILMCGISMLVLSGMSNTFEGYVLFVWTYGFFCGGYNYSLKVYTYERVRARNFAYAWSCVQCSQSIPIVVGVFLSGYLSENYSRKSSYVFSFFCTLIGSLILFLVDVHKRNISQQKKNRNSDHACVVGDCSKNRKLSFSQEPDNEIALNLSAATANQLSDIIGHQLSEDMVGSLNAIAIEKPELTCISEEGIADMDLPDNLFDEFDYIGDCITSCNKVENYLVLSEFENNLNVKPIIVENTDVKLPNIC